MQVRAFASQRYASTLVIADHNGTSVNAAFRSTVAAASKIGGDVTALVAGSDSVCLPKRMFLMTMSHFVQIAAEVAKISGINKVLVAAGDYAGLLPGRFHFLNPIFMTLYCDVESMTPVILAAQEKFTFSHILAPASAAGKNILPRVAAKLDVGMISEILSVESEDTFTRPIYAGNAVATVKSTDSVKLVTVRPTSFDPVAAEGGSASCEALEGSRFDYW